MANETNPLGIVRGAAAIARVTNNPLRRTYYLLEKKILPATKEGETWVSTVDRLRAFYDGGGAP